jgi:hypothetical protein
MPHDLKVRFEAVVVPGDEVDFAAFECWSHRDGDVVRHYTEGPCPKCGATVQGSIDNAPKPTESQGPGTKPMRPPPKPVEIPVTCLCGHDHGSEGAKGCGRRWTILAPRETA